ncbi:hypothetical protein C8R44DRAFT_717147 [Mycena epipterygia]|nr:hypothetical protein C8R44DRAFT_717147 [Mycena epipterygia]
MRRAGTVRAPTRPQIPEAAAGGSTSAVETWVAGNASTVGRVHSLSHRDRTDQSAASSSSVSAPLPAPAPTAPRANQHHTPYPGAPRVPAAPTPAVRVRRATAAEVPEPTATIGPAVTPAPATRTRDREERHHHAHAHAHPTGPYRDEDVLLSLQLLAYLSKYPHVRQAFYKRRNGEKGKQAPGGQQLAFLRAFGVAGKEKEKGKAPVAGSSRGSTVVTPATPAASTSAAARPALETNVFSLVERFTFRPSSSETDLPNPPPKLPQEIQYWAGVIMRNACRKDDSRGGIRQCANMLCGRWEKYPREFAKCRRCRKAKYCGKECQSTAWSEGHRFWCSAKEGDDAPDTTVAISSASNMATSASNATITPDAPDPNAIIPVGAERRERRERHAARERERLAAESGTTAADAATVRGFRSAGILGAHPNTVSAVFGGPPAPAAAAASALSGPSRERAPPASVPATESTRTRAMALLRRTGNPLGAVGTPAPAPQRRDREREPRERDRETNSSYATFDTYMAERRRAETSAAAASAGASPVAPAVVPGIPSYLHHPQPQNPADIDRYLASFASPPRRRVSRTSRDGDSSLARSGGTIREPPLGSGSSATNDQDNMVLE